MATIVAKCGVSRELLISPGQHVLDEVEAVVSSEGCRMTAHPCKGVVRNQVANIDG